jgi:hypothetical protein
MYGETSAFGDGEGADDLPLLNGERGVSGSRLVKGVSRAFFSKEGCSLIDLMGVAEKGSSAWSGRRE